MVIITCFCYATAGPISCRSQHKDGKISWTQCVCLSVRGTSFLSTNGGIFTPLLTLRGFLGENSGAKYCQLPHINLLRVTNRVSLAELEQWGECSERWHTTAVTDWLISISITQPSDIAVRAPGAHALTETNTHRGLRASHAVPSATSLSRASVAGDRERGGRGKTDNLSERERRGSSVAGRAGEQFQPSYQLNK